MANTTETLSEFVINTLMEAQYATALSNGQIQANQLYLTPEAGNATQSQDGLMSAADKTKLDGIATGANKTTVDSAFSASSTNPVQNKVVYAKNLWLYRGTAAVDSWTAEDDAFKQWVSFTAVDGGPAITANTNLSTPMTAQTNSADTNATLQAALGIINNGYTVTGSGGAYVYVWEKPSCDITVYWYAR